MGTRPTPPPMLSTGDVVTAAEWNKDLVDSVKPSASAFQRLAEAMQETALAFGSFVGEAGPELMQPSRQREVSRIRCEYCSQLNPTTAFHCGDGRYGCGAPLPDPKFGLSPVDHSDCIEVTSFGNPEPRFIPRSGGAEHSHREGAVDCWRFGQPAELSETTVLGF